MCRTAPQAVVCTMKLVAKMGGVLLNLLAIFLVIYSVALLVNSNFNMGNLMVWLLTVAVVCYTVWRVPINAWFATGVGRVVFWILALLLAAYLGIIAFVAVTGNRVTVTGNEQVMVVLGAGLRGDKPSNLLRARLDKAYDYAVQHPELLVITTGGQGRDEWVPEGQAMRDYLIERGLSPDRVIAETKSTSTEENFAFALDLLQARQGENLGADTAIVCVTNNFHCYRGVRYAAAAGFTNVTVLPAPTPPASILQCYMREALALCYYWVFKTSASGPMHALVGVLDLNKKFFYRNQ